MDIEKSNRREFLLKSLKLTTTCLYATTLLPLIFRCKNGVASSKSDSKPTHPETDKSSLVPSYLKLAESGELKRRGEELWKLMERCSLCPRECGVNRIKGVRGFCHANATLEIASFHPHFGEEKGLVGKYGSGTIFFTNCNLRCVFCINWEISQEGKGEPKTIEELADMMIKLQKMKCHNINLVTPTHYLPHILLALDRAVKKGLSIPIVYNTSGWEKVEVLRKLDGIVDIYLPDFKYWDPKIAVKYSAGAFSYPKLTQLALLEMNRQVGVAKPQSDGLIHKGLMIRHLVMPNRVAGTKEVVEWIAKNLPKDTYLNILSQYTPVYKAKNYPEINRRITLDEYNEAVSWARKAGLTNIDIQPYRDHPLL